ncbi:MAG: L-aspartate oxidase [Pirellulaceae bacterium]|nr:L-aspartate oxidase [Pirellulaceae bacterium]
MIPNYLVPFHPRRIAHYFTDVLVIGGGLAGLRAVNSIGPDLSVTVVTKEEFYQSNSHYAQGGIAGVWDPNDRFADHISDTIRAGADLCDAKVVEMVIKEGPDHIQKLIEWGTKFDEKEGRLALGREGGHNQNRVIHALGDATGKEIMRAMLAQTETLPKVQMWEKTFTIDLLVEGGVCRGALIWNREHGKTLVWAKQTILATGGAGQLYRETTNPSVATADGHAIAYRAGAELRDMEFMQFHPTMLYIAGGARSLITEAVRGEGAYLIDRYGNRFVQEYDRRGELAPRDIVSQAIVSQMEKTHYPHVYLQMDHLDPSHVLQRFPGIAKRCQEFGIDITKDRIPVRPGAHYMIGGVVVDRQGQTTLPGLWGAGEVTSSGLHGANRLASNSLLESLVYGEKAGIGADRAARAIEGDYHVFNLESRRVDRQRFELDLVDIRNSLKSLMWRSVGVEREADSLQESATTVEQWCQYVLGQQFTTPVGWELQNMLLVARMMIDSALQREESRGVHLRNDFRQLDNQHWQHHLSHKIRAE